LLITVISPTKALGYELAIELTYPIKTGNSTGLMVLSVNLFAGIIGIVVGELFEDYNLMSTEQQQFRRIS